MDPVTYNGQMFITKCDICKKQIKESANAVLAGYGHGFAAYSFCDKCGKPVSDFLIKNELINKHTNNKSKKYAKK